VQGFSVDIRIFVCRDANRTGRAQVYTMWTVRVAGLRAHGFLLDRDLLTRTVYWILGKR